MKNKFSKKVLTMFYILCYGALCLLIMWVRIPKHWIKYKLTKNIEHLYEVEHYLAMKRFSKVYGFNAP